MEQKLAFSDVYTADLLLGSCSALKHKALDGTSNYDFSERSNFTIIRDIESREKQETSSGAFESPHKIFSAGVHQFSPKFYWYHLCACLMHIKHFVIIFTYMPITVSYNIA